MTKRIFIVLMLSGLIFGLTGLAEALPGSIIDTFVDESMISAKNNLTVNTSPGNVALEFLGEVSGSGTFYSTTDDGDIAYRTGTTYAATHDASSGNFVLNSGTYHYIGQLKSSSTNWDVHRTGLFFDTSGLPDGASVTSANLSLSIYVGPYGTPWSLVVVNGSDLNTPMVSADYGELLDETISLGSVLGTSHPGGKYTIALNSAGLNEISQTDITKLTVRQDKDISRTAPSGHEYVGIYQAEAGGSYSPALAVNYTAPSYETTGNLVSTNLLSGQYVSSIDSFGYNASSISTGENIKVQFSPDNSNWYDSGGLLGEWETLSEGIGIIDLSSLGWSGGNFYYKTEFNSTDSSLTSVLDEISLNYTAGVIPEPASLLLLGFGVAGIAVFKRRII